MSVKIMGVVTLISNLQAASRSAPDAAEDEVDRARLAVESTAKRLIQRGPKTGHPYRRGEKWHIASAPGQPPATDTGELVSSIQSKMVKKGNQPSALVWTWTETEHAKWLEFGTSHIAPRPFFTPSLEELRPKYPGVLGKAVVKKIKETIK